jgi:dihydrofolate reductase
MRKLVESTFMTLDGVISNPHEWGRPYWDDEHAGYGAKLFDRADAMLLGRATYEAFAQAWPQRSGESADRFNAMPKHVASRTLTETTWNASLIEGDVVEGVAALKAQDGGDLIKYGTGELDRRSRSTGSWTSSTSGSSRSWPGRATASSTASTSRH